MGMIIIVAIFKVVMRLTLVSTGRARRVIPGHRKRNKGHIVI